MVHRTIIITLLLTIVLAASAAAETQTYVSLRGGFYITYPENWVKVDYWLVDAYLMRHEVDTPILDYEVAFASENAPRFFDGEYLILTIDTVGELKEWQIDSVLIELVRSFDRKVKFNSISDFLADPEAGVPSYDTLTQTVTIMNEIPEQQGLKMNLLVMKFYERGIATFYFYSPDSLFETSKYLFEQTVKSFSTENIEDALPKEQLKVADLKDVKSISGDENKNSKKVYVIVGAALVLLIIVLIRLLRKR